MVLKKVSPIFFGIEVIEAFLIEAENSDFSINQRQNCVLYKSYLLTSAKKPRLYKRQTKALP